ncbi:hypothetical protein BGX31_002130 [Mortierella sp. GBA43]|nr:hypothetical protein BGX31_002130 [Mortierella sp. GBA43]
MDNTNASSSTAVVAQVGTNTNISLAEFKQKMKEGFNLLSFACTFTLKDKNSVMAAYKGVIEEARKCGNDELAMLLEEKYHDQNQRSLLGQIMSIFGRAQKLPAARKPRRKSESDVNDASGVTRDDKRPKLDEPDNMVGPGRKDSNVDKHYIFDDGSKDGYDVTKPLMKLRDTLVEAQKTLRDVDDLLNTYSFPLPTGYKEQYRPDYFGGTEGMPVVIVEVKKPGDPERILRKDQRKLPSLMKLALNLMWENNVAKPIVVGLLFQGHNRQSIFQ